VVKITNTDGSIRRIASGESWQASTGNDSWQPANAVAELGDTRLGDPGPMPQPAASFRRTIEIQNTISSARLYVTALGSYRVFLNGKRISSDLLTPEFTDYRKRVLYQTYDVTEYFNSGKNQISALLGDGWYAGRVGSLPRQHYGEQPQLLATLEAVCRDTLIAAPTGLGKTQLLEMLLSRARSVGLRSSRTTASTM